MRVLVGGTGKADASLLSGILYFLSSVRQRFEVETPYIVAGIDGTEALIAVQPRQALAIAAVREGLVSAFDRAIGRSSIVSVPAGEAAFRSATVRFQSAPVSALPEPFRSLLIVSDSAVDWAVYYPPIMFVEDTGSRAVREAIALLSSGDYDRAMVALHAARNLAPEEVNSLQTIIAVARNRIDEAERWSQRALTANPRFAPAYVAASYVRQAEGDLNEALVQASTAAKIAPDNAYVMARLAELHMIVGSRRSALRTAEQSLASRRTPLALFVAGLARLAAWEYRKAEEHFGEAIRIDPEAPLPRLGLGLAFIRQGRTADGAWEIERAVAHDPRGAALRTWLGRAYFDEGQREKSADQFEISKREDPNDPTPYLFAALERYAANDPIGALRELQKAEKRGGARRVIRSERGLNEDTAARGAALGRVFDVLGFEQLAITAGAAGADADPANPGVHRFLADTYRQRPGYEVAQTSELLRSQLLSPPSKTPVQPDLAEAHLALLDTTGTARVTFAEFAPFFDSDGLRIDASGLVGTQHTWGDEVAVTGMYRGTSVSVGQYHYETDGYRANNDLQHDIIDAVATIALNPEFSIFGNIRHRETEGGDRRLNFNLGALGAFDPTFRSEEEHKVYQAGFHAEPSSNSDLIALYSRAELSTDSSTSLIFPITSSGVDEADSVQIQYIRNDENLNSVVGGNYVEIDREFGSTFFGFPLPVAESTVNYYNAYAYFYIDMPEALTWTIGGSVVSYDDSSGVADYVQFNPKVGLEARLGDNVTIRGAYLRNVKPDRVAEQVIEPTTVAGFNQFYDTFNGSSLEQVGGGVDVDIGGSIMFGAEAIGRWWDVPLPAGPDAETTEEVYRAYVYVVLTDHLSLAAELLHERSESDAPFDFAEWKTTSLPVTLSFFGDSGLFGSIGAEFVDHEFSNPFVGGKDHFAIANASLGLRLPNGAGVISLEGQNLFDEQFNFQNRSIRPDLTAAPRYAPERTVIARGTIKF